MPRRAFRFYQRHRIVNVNLNIVGAGLLAVIIAKWPVHLVTGWVGEEYKFINSVIAAVIDGVVDIGLYFVLHWVANHWRPTRRGDEHDLPEQSASFWREASLVQFERLTLTPAFYVIAIGGMWGLQHAGMRASWAFVLSFSAGLVVTRIVHTWWGLRTGRFERIPLRTGPAPMPEEASGTDSDAA
jgi:hypothetical protein